MDDAEVAALGKLTAADTGVMLRAGTEYAHVEIVGTKTTSGLYGAVVDSYEAWKIQGGGPVFSALLASEDRALGSA
ncbi:hypothetical protein [Amycolatopsis sp. GA6-003]|uniref:hypothetical protein n=1 Tax=Amycolatopsis sp. GA6-003 TaxID=2652444 RepID=UPI0039170AF8